MDLEAIFELVRGEGGVIFLLLLAVFTLVRGGLVTGKAYETMIKAYESRLTKKDEEVKEWRDRAIRALEAGEKVVNGGRS